MFYPCEKEIYQLHQKITSLQERLALSYGEFASQKEKEAYDNFNKKHMHERLLFKYNNGRIPYIIPTHVGIDTVLTVVCPICGETENITDTEAW